MTLELYKDAVLTRDVPEHGLKRYDIVKLVDEHIGLDGTLDYSIEIFSRRDGCPNALGEIRRGGQRQQFPQPRARLCA